MALLVSALVLGMLISAGQGLAAHLDTFAKVNLVQGIEAAMGSVGLQGDTAAQASEINISGPADYCVEVQMAALEAQSQWTDKVSADGVKLDAQHDALGVLTLDFPFDGLNFEKMASEELAANTTRYIVTLTYE